jgi:hypothetical protein
LPLWEATELEQYKLVDHCSTTGQIPEAQGANQTRREGAEQKTGLKYMRDRILRTNEESEPCWDEVNGKLKCTENCVMPTRNIESEVDKLDQGKISSLYSAGSWF